MASLFATVETRLRRVSKNNNANVETRLWRVSKNNNHKKTPQAALLSQETRHRRVSTKHSKHKKSRTPVNVSTKDMKTKTLYHNLYRVETTRLDWHCYNTGIYFVTICTQNKWHYFGEIPSDEAVIYLTPLGKATEQIIRKMEQKRKGLRIPVFCIMPNHVHIVLDMRECALPEKDSPKHTNLSVTLNLFKGAVTRCATQMGIDFAWQKRYWEHIIRDNEYNQIATYITHNVETWQLDSLRE